MARIPVRSSSRRQEAPRGAGRALRSPPPRRLVLLVATRKGAWLFHGDRQAQDMAGRRAALPRPHRQPSAARPARWPHAAGGGEDRPPRPDRVPLDQPRAHLDRRRRSRRPSRRRPRAWQALRAAASITPSGSRPATPASATPGTRAPRRRACSAPKTAASPGSRCPSINDDPQYREWMGTVQDGTPDGPKLHSIIVDPRDPAHLYFAMSGGGVHESTDGGRTLDDAGQGARGGRGLRPDHASPSTTRTVVRLCPSNPDRLYQQNHCGIYRLDRPGDEWVRIGRKMPKRGRRHRLSAGRASARRRHRVGVPDGRHQRLAAHQPAGPARRPTARATAARPGSASMPGCPTARPGGPSSARR